MVLTRLLRVIVVVVVGQVDCRSQNPHFNLILGAWFAINSIYLKK